MQIYEPEIKLPEAKLLTKSSKSSSSSGAILSISEEVGIILVTVYFVFSISSYLIFPIVVFGDLI